MTTCIFLDFDGPMIPVKAFYLPNQTKPARIFDPCAVALLLSVIKRSNAKLVISSTHRQHGITDVKRTLRLNGLPVKALHKDWATPIGPKTRSEEIKQWLSAHPDVTNYVAIDDEKLTPDVRAVRCSTQDGFGMLNYIESKLILNAIDVDSDVPEEEQIKRMKMVLDFYKT